VWEKSVQGHILGSFFYGYLVSQIPGGLLAERFGGKWIIAGFLGVSTVATLLTPAASRISFGLLIALRVLCGIGSVCFILLTRHRIDSDKMISEHWYNSWLSSILHSRSD